MLYIWAIIMQNQEVIAIRVPKKLKKELKELNINYPEEVRNYLEKKVRQKLLKIMIAKASKSRKKLEKEIGMTSNSAELIREDREHGH